MASDRSGGFLIARIHQVGNRIFNQMLKDKGIDLINSAQGRILYVLWKGDGISIGELGEKTGLKKSSLTSMLDRLEERDLLERRPSPTDRRTVLIFRTEKDRELQNIYDDVSRSMTDLFYKGISEEEIDQFEDVLGRILENLT